MTLILSILITEGVGFLSAFISGNIGNNNQFYNTLNKPFFSPPAGVFKIVWTILYLLMGIAFYRIIKLREDNIDIKLPVTLYIIQLILNFLWSIIFFRFNSIKCAFIEIIILFIFIILTILEFRKYDRKAALLMIPYVIWVAFAIYLNYSILMLNM